MKIFLINLEKNFDRLQFVDEQLKRFNLQYERFPAVYGKELSLEQREGVFSSFRARLISGQSMPIGLLGCTLSHLGVYKHIIKDNLPFALILEDDIVLAENFLEMLSLADKFVDPNKPQVVLFSGYGGHVDVPPPNGVYRLFSGACADAYLITLAAAKLILKVNTPVIVGSDAWSYYIRRFSLELYRVYPVSVKQANQLFDSDIANWAKVPPTKLLGTDGTGREGISWLLFKTRRMFEKTLDYILFILTGH